MTTLTDTFAFCIITHLPKAGVSLDHCLRTWTVVEMDLMDYFYGADARIRTADLLITNQLLYQLSYIGTLGH